MILAMLDAVSNEPFLVLGLFLILLGIIVVAVPFLMRVAPSLENFPPILFWVYRKDNLYIATSPILIIISLVSIVLYLLGMRR